MFNEAAIQHTFDLLIQGIFNEIWSKPKLSFENNNQSSWKVLTCLIPEGALKSLLFLPERWTRFQVSIKLIKLCYDFSIATPRASFLDRFNFEGKLCKIRVSSLLLCTSIHYKYLFDESSWLFSATSHPQVQNSCNRRMRVSSSRSVKRQTV